MPTILLIRHGENDYVKEGRLAGRLAGVHLNDKGRKQAQALAEKLASAPVKAVYSSPLDRTMETAEPIAAALGLEIIPRQGLLELDFGKWQNKKLKKLQKNKLWPTVQQRPSLMRFPGGETFAEAQLRVAAELDELSSLHAPKDLIICVSHSDLIKLAAAYFVGLPLDQFQRMMVAPASITSLHIGQGHAHLLNLNYSLGLAFPQPEKKEKEAPDDSQQAQEEAHS